jgi:hypothetical protein
LKGKIFGVCALLTAGAAQAERVSEPYANVGDWEITAENHRECGMKRLYGSSVAEKEQGLIVLYDAQRQAASLTWVTRKPQFPPLSDSLHFDLAFLKGSAMNESWGSQPFQVQKGDGYGFTHVFLGTAAVQRILRDLASHETIALFFGPTLMTGLHLDASDAVAKLRECSSKIAERNSVGPLQR